MIKEIKGFHNYYVSDIGEIYSNAVYSGNKNGVLRKLKPETHKKTGYNYIQLCKDGKVFMKTVHRLVAETFIPNPYNKCDVNHKNGIKTDNRIENLEWTTRSENTKHVFTVLNKKGWLAGKFGKDNPNSHIILQIKDNKIVGKFYGGKEAQRKTGISQSNIWKCCLGIRKSAGGYRWKYAEY